MKKLTKLLKKFYLPLIVIFIAFLSYNYNFFRVANNWWFVNHDIFSEQIVIEGVINGKDEHGKVFLGRITRDNQYFSDQTNTQVRKLKNKKITKLDEIEKNVFGKFKRYASQYGLQVNFFYFLKSLGIKDVEIFKGVTALLMSVMVGVLFQLFKKRSSLIIASAFVTPLILSPYVVVFARNLYWMEVLWFLPMVVTIYYGKKDLILWKSKIKFFIFLFIAYLLKMLCGYEYLSTICIASIVPIIFYMSWDKNGIKQSIIKLSLSATATIFAFIFAISLHVQAFSKSNSTISDNIDYIISIAKVRTKANSPSEIKELCKYRQDIFKQNVDLEILKTCENSYNKRMSRSPFKVFIRYLIFDDFLPWLGNFSNMKQLNLSPDKSKGYEILKRVWLKPNLETIKDAFFKIDTQIKKNIIIIFLNTLSFLSLIAIAFYKSSTKIKLALTFSFCAHLSWILLAHGHSVAHFEFNYVLWYLPLIPFCFVAILPNNNKVI